MTDGEMIKFFHQEALTTVSIARLALKYNIPLIPARAIRIGRAFNFIAKIEKPIEFKKSSHITEQEVIDLMTKVNNKLAEWIKEYPSQWFWVHNRWKK
jgi:KDO2-lipid IV(A) lauroyltransferase